MRCSPRCVARLRARSQPGVLRGWIFTMFRRRGLWKRAPMLPELHQVLNLLEGGFTELKVLVVGDIMLDRYIHGEVERISPEAPVPVLSPARRYERAGGAANVAMNLAGLGCQTFLAGFWGNDSEQSELAAILERAGIDTVGVVSTSLPTISKTRIVGRTQQLLRLDIESRDTPPVAEAQRLHDRATELVAKVHAVILSDYAKGALSTTLCEAIIRAARTAGIPILADPKTHDFSKYTGATTVCPNLGELAAATGIPAHQTNDLLAAGQALVAEHDLKFLTVTMSEKGISVLRPASPGTPGIYHSPARAREVFDVSGAGDTVIATLAASLAAVDAVVLFEEDTPLELIRALKPNVLVKGGDYTIETVVGHEDVLAAGGRVEIVPTVEGFSTSNIVKKLTANSMQSEEIQK